MFTDERPVWAEIDLDALIHNMEGIRKKVGDRRILAVVKADAYGHGMKEVAHVMRSCGIDDFAVAILPEAMALRSQEKDASILILGFTPVESAWKVVENDLTVTVFSYEDAQGFSKEAERQGKDVRISIVLDTGMSRIGFNTAERLRESVEEIVRISRLPRVIMEEVYSHFSTSDEKDKTYSNFQFSRFLKAVELLKERSVVFNHYHHANSGAIMDLPDTYMDTVRPGIIQYGYYPSDDVDISQIDLKPILSWKAKLVLIKDIESGTPVSYGNTYVAEGRRRIGTLPIGYADGYSRFLSNKGHVIVNGKKAPIAGRVCMDQFMVDLTGIEDVHRGDTVILLGKEGDESFTAHDMASLMGTISYEITCDIGKRVDRRYILHGRRVELKDILDEKTLKERNCK